MIRWLLRWLRGVRPAIHSRRIRLALMDARTARLRAIATRERMDGDQLDDALTLLAQQYPVTLDQALDLVDRHGLEGAAAFLAEADA